LQRDFAEIYLKFYVKTQYFSKETGRFEKIQQFQMQFPQLSEPQEGVAWRGGPCCPVRAFLKHPNIQLKTAKSLSFHLTTIFHH
jgi:hypothetical protein